MRGLFPDTDAPAVDLIRLPDGTAFRPDLSQIDKRNCTTCGDENLPAYPCVACEQAGAEVLFCRRCGVQHHHPVERTEPMSEIAAAGVAGAVALLTRVKGRLHTRADEIDRQAYPQPDLTDEQRTAISTPMARMLREVASCISVEVDVARAEIEKLGAAPPDPT